MKFHRIGDKPKVAYRFVDKDCIGRACWAPGMFQHRSPMSGGGSRNTGSPDTPCCMNNAYRGCPVGPVGERREICDKCAGTGENGLAKCHNCAGYGSWVQVGLPEADPELKKKRIEEGWRAKG